MRQVTERSCRRSANLPLTITRGSKAGGKSEGGRIVRLRLYYIILYYIIMYG